MFVMKPFTWLDVITALFLYTYLPIMRNVILVIFNKNKIKTCEVNHIILKVI